MSTTAVPDMVGWLVDTFTAAATLGAATPPVAVHCGPELSEDFSGLALYVAVDDPLPLAQGGTITGAVSNQDWAGAGDRKRNEVFSVYCTAEAWSGDVTTRAAMTAVYGIVAAVEDILRTNTRSTALGGASAQILELPGSTGHAFRWYLGDEGIAARVLFRIDLKSRIGT